MPRRAPWGTGRVQEAVRSMVDRYGLERTARMLDIPQSRITRMIEAVRLSDVVRSPGGLASWRRALAEATIQYPGVRVDRSVREAIERAIGPLREIPAEVRGIPVVTEPHPEMVVRPQIFRSIDEAALYAQDLITAGVPPDFIAIIEGEVPGTWKVAALPETP